MLYFFRLGDSAGGAERMLCRLACAMAARGHEVQLVSWDEEGARAFYALPPDAKWHQLGFSPGLTDKFRRTRALHRTLIRERPDAFVGFVMSADKTVYTANLLAGVPIVAAERNSPVLYRIRMSPIQRALSFQLFRACAAITVQIESYRRLYPPFLRERVTVIPNPVELPEPSAATGHAVEKDRVLLAVSRLDNYQKRLDVLLNAFAKLSEAFPAWRLRIVGDGNDGDALKSQARELGLTERVEFAGAVEDVAREYRRASLFVISSRWEGFPNALAEAMSHGLPAVGFAGADGVRDLVRDGETGCLATGNGDAAALAESLARLMSNDGDREVMGANARGDVARYVPQKVFDAWERLLHDVAAEHGRAA